MRGIAFEVAGFHQSSFHPNNLKESNYGFNNNNNNNEPISVLDTRSPSPSTSTSTLSSSVGGGANGSTTTTPPLPPISGDKLQQKSPESIAQEKGVNGCVAYNETAVAGEGRRKDDWPELQLVPAEFELQQQRFGVGLEDWEKLLSGVVSSPAREQSLRWISGEFDDAIDQNAPTATVYDAPSVTNFNTQNPNLLPFCNVYQNLPVILNPLLPPPPVRFRHHRNLLKTPVSDMGLQKVSVLNQGFHKVSILNQDQELLLEKPSTVTVIKQELPQTSPLPPHHHHHHQQLICDQLLAIAELLLAGNHSHAQEILARLNHQFALAATATATTPFRRAAFCFKEAMQMQMQTLSNLNPNRVTPPSIGVFKMGAYKMFSEVSPVVQFMNFTSNQTLLEALGDAKNIHIIDFDIGFGAQWASFIQELPIRNNNGGDGEGCSLKITAFASPSTHHPLELGLMHENLSQFAQEIGISFKLEVVNFDSFDPRWFSVSDNETVAVNFPIWSACSHLSAIPFILHFVKQLSPRIVVTFDRGCERTDLPFPHYLLQGLQYYEVLLDSIDGANGVSDASNKIERYLFQPQIEHMVMGKLQYPEPMPHWKSLFTAGGYSPVRFSNFAETQAECVLKRMQVQGFRVEKRQASLVLCWKDRVLMTASAWKC